MTDRHLQREKKRERDRAYMRARRSTRPDVVARERAYMRDVRNADPIPFLIRAAKCRARKQHVPFDLTIEWARTRWTGSCELTGIAFRPSIGGQTAFSPSIDRRESLSGYVQSNCRFVLSAINSFKGSADDETMLLIARALLGYCRG